MNKSRNFKKNYYICFLLSTFVMLGGVQSVLGGKINLLLGIINAILVIIFSIKSMKKKLKNVNVLFPIFYMIFLILMILLMFVMNNKLVLPYIHFNYYGALILINYLLLNIYSVLSCFTNKNN